MKENFDISQARATIVLNIVVALGAEAQPLIHHFKLKQVSHRPFKIYQGEIITEQPCTYQVNLIVSGSGVIKASSAVSWLAAEQQIIFNTAESQKASTFWINIGTAGHKSLSVGSACWVSSYQGLEQQKRQIPLLAKWRVENPEQKNKTMLGIVRGLLTVSRPTQDYPNSELVDMEGLGFFESARHFARVEYIQALKIISDNERCSIEDLDKSAVQTIISDAMGNIEQFIFSQLGTISLGEVCAHQFDQCLETARSEFLSLKPTVTQVRQFNELMQKLNAFPSDDLEDKLNQLLETLGLGVCADGAASSRSNKSLSKEFLSALESLLSMQRYSLGQS